MTVGWAYWETLIWIIGSDALLAYALWRFWGRRQQPVLERDKESDAPTALGAIQEGAASDAMRDLDRSIRALHARVGRLEEQGRVTSRGAYQGNDAVEVATRLAGTGADVRQLVALCGLTEAEAELISLLHDHERPAYAVSAQGAENSGSPAAVS